MHLKKASKSLIVLSFVGIQLGFSQDYLVTAKGDTIQGEVKPIFAGVEKKVVVSTADRTKASYGILQVKSYFLKGEIFHTMRTPEGYTFMKLLKSGYLSLYAFQQNNQLLFDGLFLRKIDGGTMEVPNLGFKKLMKEFLSDCPGVADSINTGTWGKRDIEQIVDSYNECILGKSTQTQPVQKQKTNMETNAWTTLEEMVQQADFEQKADVLDMIADAKAKIVRGEPIPNYLVKTMTDALKDTDLKEYLDKALIGKH